MNPKRLWTGCILAVCLFLLTGCGGTRSSETQNEGPYTIVTSFYPIYVEVLNVTRDIPDIQVVNMTQPQTGCLHDYAITTEDMKTLEKARIFVINGAGMEAFMDKVTGQIPGLKVVDSSSGIKLLEEEGEKNPHVWVSITNAIQQVKNIGEGLAAADSSHAEQYRDNAQTYIKKLEAQRDKMHKALDGLKNRDIVTFHEAFPYFAREFNLNIAAVVEREPGTEPSPKELADTIEAIRKSGIKALFAEPQYSAKAAGAISRETGAKVYTLDPGVTGQPNGDFDAYLKAMDQNMKVLEEALG